MPFPVAVLANNLRNLHLPGCFPNSVRAAAAASIRVVTQAVDQMHNFVEQAAANQIKVETGRSAPTDYFAAAAAALQMDDSQ